MTRYVINPDCLRTDIDDETIILNTTTGKYLKLNSTSKFILDCIEDELDATKIIKKINAHYTIGELEAKSSLEDFVNIALEKKIIHLNQN